MIELTMPNRYVGRIFDVVAPSELENGDIVALDGANADNEGAYDAKLPATADLGDVAYYIINQDEFSFTGLDLDSEFSVATGELAKAYPLVVNAEVNIPARKITGTATNGEFLVPADGDSQLTAAADLTGGTKVALKVVNANDTILEDGKRVESVLARVIQA